MENPELKRKPAITILEQSILRRLECLIKSSKLNLSLTKGPVTVDFMVDKIREFCLIIADDPQG